MAAVARVSPPASLTPTDTGRGMKSSASSGQVAVNIRPTPSQARLDERMGARVGGGGGGGGSGWLWRCMPTDSFFVCVGVLAFMVLLYMG